MLMGKQLETKLNKISDILSSVEVSFAKSEVEEKIKKTLLDIQKNYEIKGFRKGKVPMNIIKQRFQQEVLNDACVDIVQEEFNKILQENKLNLAGPPALKSLDVAADPIVAVLEYETHPDIDLVDFKEVVIDEPVYVPDDDAIEFIMKTITLDMGEREEAETVEDTNCIIVGDFISKDKTTGETLQEMTNETIQLYSYELPEAFAPKFIGKRVGDELEIDFAEIDPLRSNETFHAKINKILKIKPAELTPEAISDLSDGRFDTIEDLKEDVGLLLQDYFDRFSTQTLENNIVAKIHELYKDISMPQSILDGAIANNAKENAKKFNTTEETLLADKSFVDSITAELKKFYIFDAVSSQLISKEGLELEDDDIADYFETVGLPREMGSLDVLQNIDKKNKTELTNQLLSQKVINYLKSVVTTNNVDIDEKLKKMHVSRISYYNAAMRSKEAKQAAKQYHHDHHEEHIHDENCDHEH